MKILALEPWYGGSHQHFLDGLMEHSTHEFRAITMPGRFWRWRMEGGAVTLARKAQQVIEEGFHPDLLFVSDMVNLPAFVSLARPHFGDMPIVSYFHENQLTYPIPPDRERERAYGIINYLSALTADRVAFNSQFHFEEFVEALPLLLRDFPDFTNLSTVQDIRAKSSVLHLGMNLEAHEKHDAAAHVAERHSPTSTEAPIVLWNQRWEYDKNPEAFFQVMNRLDDAGYDFRLILAGEHFHEQPEAFETAFERYAERILHYGYAEDFDEYSRLLHRADIVVSTSRHEFFGVAIMEAVYCGCHPLLPNRLSYPELIPDELHEPLLHAPVLYEDEDALFKALGAMLAGEERPLPPDRLREIPARFDWRTHADRYDALFEEIAAERSAVAAPK